jgi:hypothetical protein
MRVKASYADGNGISCICDRNTILCGAHVVHGIVLVCAAMHDPISDPLAHTVLLKLAWLPRAVVDCGPPPSGPQRRQHYFSRSAPLVSGVRQIAMIAMIA